MARIFLSYRRADSDIWVARLAESLAREVGAERVFQDVTGIAPGADFVEALDRALDEAAVTLVVIGPRWLSAADKQGRRRLDQPGDFVRLEVAESLKRVRVFPVLVNGAEMPGEDDLPDPLKPLARRQALELTVRHWDKDVAELAKHIAQVPGVAAAGVPPAEASSRTPPKQPTRDEQGPSRRGLAAVLIGVAVAALAAIGVVYMGGPRDEPPTRTAAPDPTAAPAPAPEPVVPKPAPDAGYTGPSVALRTQDTFTPSYGYSWGLRLLAAAVEYETNGRLKLELLPAGAVATRGVDILEAVAKGTLHVTWTFPGMFAVKDPAFALVDTPPFGPTPEQYLKWRRRETVASVVDEMYAALGLRGIPCGVVWVADLWASSPIPNGSALKGRKIRSAGILRAEIFNRSGATYVALPGGEMFPAMEKGSIDAVQFLDPASGMALGLQDVARVLYFPARFTPAAGIDLVVNPAKWDELGASGQRVVREACERNGRSMLETGRADQQAAVAKIVLKGVAVEELPADVLDTLRTAWRAVAKERSANPAFARLYESLREYDPTGR